MLENLTFQIVDLAQVPSESLPASAAHNVVELEQVLHRHEEGLQSPFVLSTAPTATYI